MIDGKLLIEKLLVYADAFLGLNALDVIYQRNYLLRLFGFNSPTKEKLTASMKEEIRSMQVPDVLIDEIMAFSLENKLAENDIEADLFANFVMGVLSPRPSEVNNMFMSLKEKRGSQTACDYLYNLCIKNYYIRKSAIDKNLKWDADKQDIPFEVTINLSKPEKNNKDVAKLLTAPKSEKYPECNLCKENEGFYGTLTHPARTNLRTISLTLAGEDWAMQYSPYLYFDEHCILFSKKHTPMCVNGTTIERLFDFIELFPNYFVGSNSDLPIVGGSILNHEHYQGGKHVMPLHKAKAFETYKCDDYPDTTVEVVDFYNSVVRISGYNRNTVQALATEVIEKWKGYSDESVMIIAESDGVRHNTVTPIARFLSDSRYCIELILRNNLTTDEYPDGLYHAHPEYHNIKKEGIGLIEAMGLYILPARLKRQFGAIADILAHKVEYNADEISKEDNDLFVHRDMIAHLMKKHPRIKDLKKANAIITEYVNDVCSKILYNTSVFGKDSKGVLAFNKFLATCNIK